MQHQRVLRTLIKATLGVTVALVVLAIVGLLYQAIASARDRQATPPPGQLIEVNGHTMHLLCKGEGSPTVVLEAGLGGNWLDWVHVHDVLAQQTEVCAYDRLGNGWSDEIPSLQSSSEIATTLHTLLTDAGVGSPYVLVGQSAGGIFVRSFAYKFPEEVVGMVLVDSAHENSDLRMLKVWTDTLSEVNQQLNQCRLAAPFGLIRLLGIADGYTKVLNLSTLQKAQFTATFNRTHYCQSALLERAAYMEDIRQSAPPTPLGSLPLIVLSRGIGEIALDEESRPPNISLAELQEVDLIWASLQEELAQLSTNTTHIIAQESGHFIQVDQPDLVIKAVEDILLKIEE